jgi:hypothetical protein
LKIICDIAHIKRVQSSCMTSFHNGSPGSHF